MISLNATSVFVLSSEQTTSALQKKLTLEKVNRHSLQAQVSLRSPDFFLPTCLQVCAYNSSAVVNTSPQSIPQKHLRDSSLNSSLIIVSSCLEWQWQRAAEEYCRRGPTPSTGNIECAVGERVTSRKILPITLRAIGPLERSFPNTALVVLPLGISLSQIFCGTD